MFPEPLSDNDLGRLEVITGSMFSGKTEELLRRLRRAELAHLGVRLYKPLLDTRYSLDSVVSHDKTSLPCKLVASPRSVLSEVDSAQVVAFDEAQFFSSDLVEVCLTLANIGKRVIVAGLDMDYLGKPFSIMPLLMAHAEYVTKLHAVCSSCGELAHFSYRKSAEQNLILIGEKDEYEPLCRKCYNVAISRQNTECLNKPNLYPQS